MPPKIVKTIDSDKTTTKIVVKTTPAMREAKAKLLAMEKKQAEKPKKKLIRIDDIVQDFVVKQLPKIKNIDYSQTVGEDDIPLLTKKYDTKKVSSNLLSAKSFNEFFENYTITPSYRQRLKNETMRKKKDGFSLKEAVQLAGDKIQKTTLRSFISSRKRYEEFINLPKTSQTRLINSKRKVLNELMESQEYKNKNFIPLDQVEQNIYLFLDDLCYHMNLPRGVVRFKYVPDVRFNKKYDVLPLDVDINTNVKNSDLYKRLLELTRIDSETSIFDYYNWSGKLYIYKPSQTLPANKRPTIVQWFKDNKDETHCFFKPIREYYQEIYNKAVENNRSKKTLENYKGYLNAITKYENKYQTGIPMADIQEVCNKLKISVDFCNPYEKKQNIYQHITYSLSSHADKNFKYLNTRLNHVEVCTDDVFSERTKILVENRKELETIIEENFSQNKHTYYTRDNHNICGVYTNGSYYAVKNYNEYTELKLKFINEHLSDKSIDHIKNPELSTFVVNSTYFLGAVDFTDELPYGGFLDYAKENELIGHIDQEKCYFNAHKCTYYEGFLAKVTDFRYTTKIEGIGIYSIYNIDTSNANPKFVLYCERLKILKNHNSYPSPLLKMFDKYGIKYDILQGCWGTTFDFRIPEEFKTLTLQISGEKKTPAYSILMGAIASIKEDTKLYVKCDEQYANVLNEFSFKNGTNIYYSALDNEATITIPKEHANHWSHITAFTTAYASINTLEQLMVMNPNAVFRVVADGIYFWRQYHKENNQVKDIDNFEELIQELPITLEMEYQEPFPLMNIFIEDRKIRLGNNNGFDGEYFSTQGLVVKGVQSALGQYKPHHMTNLYLGVGGSGKTHNLLSDEGYVSMYYLAPTRKLRTKKKEEYKQYRHLNGFYTIAKALGKDKKTLDKIKTFARNIVIDEVSMLNEDDKKQLMNTFKDIKLHFCGDIGHQLNPIEGLPMNEEGFDNIEEYTFSYRIKDEALRNVINAIRKVQKSKNPTARNILPLILKTFEKVDYSTVFKQYAIDDYILCYTRKQCQFFTDKLKSRFTTTKKYRVMDSKSHTELETGQIIISDIKPEAKAGTKIEETYAFTTHCTQGETIKTNLYIDVQNMIEKTFGNHELLLQLLQTAIGRAETCKQIKIIWP